MKHILKIILLTMLIFFAGCSNTDHLVITKDTQNNQKAQVTTNTGVNTNLKNNSVVYDLPPTIKEVSN